MSDRPTSENESFYDGPVEEIELDLLVDGELDEPRRRELLARLEAAPEGWRRCALAFLEAQSFREALSGAKAEAAPPAPIPKPVPPRDPDRPSGPMHRMRLLGAMAASFLVAVVGVWYFRGGGDTGPPSTPPTLDVASDVAPSPANPAGPRDTRVGLEPWCAVNVSSPTEGGRSQWQFPAVERTAFDRGDVDRLSGGTPLHFVKSLEDSGHRLKRSRSYVPVRLQDGRSMVVPVDDYNVTREFPRFQ